jgi:dienelactone hydrolase
MRHIVTLASLLLCTAAALSAAVVKKEVSYTFEGESFTGWLVYDDAGPAERPGIMMVPNWKGISDNAFDKATMIAGTDRVVLLVDMYGSDIRPKDAKEAREAATFVRSDRVLMRARINEALRIFQAQTDIPYRHEDTAAIGLCFGGGVVLELARSGTAIDGVVSFHGDIVSPMPVTEAGVITTPILVLHGSADPLVPPEHVAAFEAEMTTAEAPDWQLIGFSGTVHSFTNPEANNPAMSQYEPRSAKRSFALMDLFFDERFAD